MKKESLYKHKPKVITSIQDLIRFFKPIPKDRWCVGDFQDLNGRRCAVGHLGAAYRGKASSGWDLIRRLFGEEHNLHELAAANNASPLDPKGGAIEYLKAQLTIAERKELQS